MAVTAPSRPQPVVATDRRGSRPTAALVAVFAVAAAVRVVVTRGLWLDEATTVAQSQLSFSALLDSVGTTDVHPPLHHAFMWAWVRVFGINELMLRLPSMLAGLALVWVVYLLAKELFSARAGLLAAAAASVSPLLVWYSQEARMYAFVLLFALTAVLAQVRILRAAPGSMRSWVLYTAATALLLWTHYFSLLYVVVQQVAFLAVAVRRRRGDGDGLLLRRWLLSAVAIAVLLLPVLPVLNAQLDAFVVRQQGIEGVPEAAAIEFQGPLNTYTVGANAAWALWGFHQFEVMVRLVALWPLLMLAGLALLGRWRGRHGWLTAALIAVPPLILLLVGTQQRFVFEIRYFLVAIPLLLVLLAGMIDQLPSRAGRLTIAVLLVGPMVAGLAHQQLAPDNPRVYEFDAVLSDLAERAGPDDLVLYEPWYLKDVVEYYAPDLPSQPLRDVEELPDDPDGSTVYVVGSFLDQQRHAEPHGSAVGTLDFFRELVYERVETNVEARGFR